MLPTLSPQRINKEAEIVFLGGTSNVEFLKLCSGINRVETFSLKACFGLLKDSYDLVVDFDQWIRTTALLGRTHAWRVKLMGLRLLNIFAISPTTTFKFLTALCIWRRISGI